MALWLITATIHLSQRLRRQVLDRRAPTCCEGEAHTTEKGQWPWQRGKQQTRMIENGCFVHLRKRAAKSTRKTNMSMHKELQTEMLARFFFLSY